MLRLVELLAASRLLKAPRMLAASRLLMAPRLLATARPRAADRLLVAIRLCTQAHGGAWGIGDAQAAGGHCVAPRLPMVLWPVVVYRIPVHTRGSA